MSKIIILVLICMTIVVNADKEFDEIIDKGCDKNLNPVSKTALDKCMDTIPKPITEAVCYCLKEMSKEAGRDSFMKVICDPKDGPKLKACRDREIKKLEDNGTLKDIKEKWTLSKECMKKAVGM